MTDSTPLPQQPEQPVYQDHDLVYVDPETRTVVGRVEWGKNDRPKSKPYAPVVKPEPSQKTEKKGAAPEKKERGQFWRKNFPWGTYRSMRRIYKLQGKVKDPEPNKTLDEVLPKALSQAYWSWDAEKPQTSDSSSASL